MSSQFIDKHTLHINIHLYAVSYLVSVLVYLTGSFHLSGILRWHHLTVDNTRVMRWSLAAADVCFKKERHALFCAMGRVVPVVRGGGVYQRGMDYMLDKLNSGAWVHTFPEGENYSWCTDLIFHALNLLFSTSW